MKPIVIIGAGLAGFGVARELRKLDTTVPIMVISQDKADFYSKPMLSNAFAQNKTAEQLINTMASKMAEQHQLAIQAETTVENINLSTQEVVTSAGVFAYSKLVLAVGASPVRLPIAGNAADKILSVNSLNDYAIFREQLTQGNRVVLLGGGLIGCEFANDLTTGGFEVTVVDLAETPIAALLPAAVGRSLQDALVEKGVKFCLGRKVVSANQEGSALNVVLDDGTTLGTDHVLSAVGLRPNTAIAEKAGLSVNRGIVADSFLKVAENVYTLGDCAEIDGQWRPYVMPITIAARSLAKTLLSEPEAVNFPVMPVQIKTPAYPILVQPAPRGVEGVWHEEAVEDGSIWQFVDTTNKVNGFVLTGKAIAAHRAKMVAAMA
ncbi:FAD-dependent oxidoreductase [Leeia sp. TBRC 13508]|uniref:FAD-dependent oxidoreductase n=1 Tax=Leeia speluncae TaxID=2884804 RepID=A0ABS8D5H6_9NEIS|nr:FAD-dependent oxidoreductase [Leeia speluncae]MCB6183221.1 FAD-dependent oxidoreductase [Leeia speluncae]